CGHFALATAVHPLAASVLYFSMMLFDFSCRILYKFTNKLTTTRRSATLIRAFFTPGEHINTVSDAFVDNRIDIQTNEASAFKFTVAHPAFEYKAELFNRSFGVQVL